MVVDGCVAAKNRARDTSWLLGRSKAVKICRYVSKKNKYINTGPWSREVY